MIGIDVDYLMCLVLHLILIILLESIARFVMRAGWQLHGFVRFHCHQGQF